MVTNVYPSLLMRRPSSARNHCCTVAELLAGAVISICLSVGAGFHLLSVHADEPPSRSGVSAGVQSSPASLLPDGVPTRKGTTSVAQKRIKRQSQDWAPLATAYAHELSPNISQWAIAAQVQSLYGSHSVSIPSGRGPPLFV